MGRMSEVTVTAVQPVLGLADGATVTIERTPRIDAHIKAGHLLVVNEAPDDAPVVEEPDTSFGGFTATKSTKPSPKGKAKAADDTVDEPHAGD